MPMIRVRKGLVWVSVCLFMVSALSHRARAHERFQFEAPAGWVKERSLSAHDESYVWLDEKGATIARVTLLWQPQAREAVRDPAAARDVKNFDKLFMAVRPKALAPLGFSQWQIEDSSVGVVEGEKGYLYQVRGSYREPDQKQTGFIEWNYFLGRNYYQVAWFQEKSKFSDRYAAMAKEILARFKPL